MTIAGDEAAQASAGRLTLAPVVVGNAAGRAGATARRASRYGRLRVFFLDDNAFMEPPGFWTRGRADTDLFVDAPEDGAGPIGAPPAIRLHAGAVAATVILSSLDWRTELTLEPGASQEVALPGGRPCGLAAPHRDEQRLPAGRARSWQPGPAQPRRVGRKCLPAPA